MFAKYMTTYKKILFRTYVIVSLFYIQHMGAV